jgi:hypothetical protein
MEGVREVNNEYIFIILNYETNDKYLTDQLKSRKKNTVRSVQNKLYQKILLPLLLYDSEW